MNYRNIFNKINMEAKPPICVIHEIITLQIYSKYFIKYFMSLKSCHLFLIFLPHISPDKEFIYNLNEIDVIAGQIFLYIFLIKLHQN